MGRFSFIGDLVQDSSKAAKNVIENGGGSANQRAKMIKNCVNTVKTNMGNGQARAVSEMGEDSGRAFKEGIQTALNQTQAKTAEKALNRTARQGNAAVQKSKEIIDSKRVNQVIDGHNARQRDVEMQTIANNVKDRNINRVPKDHETARRAVEQANETVRNARIINEPEVDPMHTPKNITYSYQNNAANPEQQVIKRRQGVGSRSQQRAMNNTQTASNTNGAVEPNFDIGNNYSTPEVEPQFAFNTGQTNTSTGGGGNTSSTNTANTSTRGNTQQRQTRSKSTRQPIDVKAKLGEKAGQYVDDFFGGITDTYNNVADGGDFLDSFKKAHQNTDGSINMKRAAGTFVAASAAARVASGGGVYKDRYGNPNLIGVPFI
jgi:hypothetical protein